MFYYWGLSINSKQSVYLSILVGFFIVGQMMPLGAVIGAPISLVGLAFFSKSFKRRQFLSIFLILTVANSLCSFNLTVGVFELLKGYMVSFGFYSWSGCLVLLIYCIIGGRVVAYYGAKEIIDKSGIRRRITL